MEIKIEKPTKYANSTVFRNETGFEYFCINNEYFISGETDEKTLLQAWENHKPVDKNIIEAEAKAAAQAKLAALGLSADDLKALGLGGNE